MSNNSDFQRSNAAAAGTDILESVGSTRTTIDWQRSAPWWFLLSGFVRLGWRISHVVFGTVGVFLSYVGLYLVERFFLPNDGNGLALQLPNLSNSIDLINLGFYRQVINAPWQLTFSSAAGLLVLFLWLAAVWGLFGGVICRRSVVELGARTTIGWSSAFRLVIRRWRAMVEAVGLPALAAFGLCAAPFLLGLFSRLGSWAEFISMFGVLLTFFFAIPIAWLLLLALLGYPLMVAAIVTEKDSDAFDGLSRSAAYLFQRPVTIILAIIVAGSIISILTSLIGGAYAASTVAYGSAYFSGAGLNGMDQLSTSFAKNVFSLVQTVIGLTVSGLAASLFWAAVSATYLLVRREVDHTDYDELDLQEMGSPLALPSSDYDDNKLMILERDKQNKKDATNTDNASTTIVNNGTSGTSNSTDESNEQSA